MCHQLAMNSGIANSGCKVTVFSTVEEINDLDGISAEKN
jgi:hypothetical protein